MKDVSINLGIAKNDVENLEIHFIFNIFIYYIIAFILYLALIITI